jgi:solute:Na+ symporter, SSS family
MSTQATIFTGVGIYLLLMIVIGIYASRSSGTADDFIVSGRRMPIWLCTATLIATWFGAGPMMGSAGASYEEGLLGVIADPFGGALVMFVCGLFFVRLFRRMKLLTFVELFDSRFGKTAATIAAVGSIVSSVGWTAAMLVAFGFVFESLTGVPVEIGIIGGAVVVFIYTSAGGMWAVALTDFVQMLIIAIGLVLLLTVVLIDVGGWSAVAAKLPEHTFRMIPLQHSPERWLNYFRAWLIFGLADITAQSLMQRAMSARSEQAAQNSFYIAGIGYLAMGMIPVMLGIIASVTMPGLADPEKVIPLLALEHLHPVAIAVFVGALLSAIMSTTDSALLGAASVFSTNILPLFKPRPSDRTRLLTTRIAIPVFGTCAVIVALGVQVVFDLIQDANSIVLVSVVVPFVAGVWWKKANRAGVLASMAAGFLAWLVALVVVPRFPGDLLGLIASLVTLLVVTPLTQSADPPKPARNELGEVVELDNRLGVLPLFRRVD